MRRESVRNAHSILYLVIVMLQIFFVAPLITPSLCAPRVDLAAQRNERQVSSSLSVNTEFELIEFSAMEDGEEVPAEMLPEMTRTTSRAGTLEFVDTVSSMEDGVVSAFERLYSTASGSSEFAMEMSGGPGDMEPVSESNEFESDLVGGKVLFEAEGDEWTPSAGDDCTVDEDDLAALRADYTFSFLTPNSMPEKGATWAIDTAHMPFLLDPIGELPTEDVDGGPGMHPGGDSDDEPEFTGDISATYLGEREVDGRTLHTIELKFDCMSEHAFDVDVEALGDGDNEGHFGPASLDVEIADVIDGTGELLVDFDLGFIEQLDIQFSIERTKVENISFDIPEMGLVEMVQSEVESGTTEVAFQSSTR